MVILNKKTKGNAELFVSIGECVIDYGNGYKMAILQNLNGIIMMNLI
jgi:hypothetical protein